jgi:3-phenylpropionate/trans-cinnamate dioxygenase ferredoxin reductase subunit
VTRPIVLVGGGLAAQRCAETLRRNGHAGPIVMVCAETVPPYDRPPLSKELLAGHLDERAVQFRPGAWYAEKAVELLLGSPAAGFDAHARELLLGDGRRLAYDRLVIATGADARGMGGGLTLRNVDDARRLRALLRPGAHLAIVGGGLIGQEVAATALRLGADVTVLEREPVPMARILGPEVAGLLARMHTAEGVRLEVGACVEQVHAERVQLAGGRTVEADAVLVAIGGAPATGWLAGTALEAPRGIPVGEGGRTAVPGVFAAGDCARPGGLGHDHWESAARQGADAARAMLGLPIGATPPHSFWSDQYGVRLHVLGQPHTADRVVIDGDIDARDLAAHYFAADGLLVGALLVGRGREMPAVRRRLIDRTTPERTAA